MKPKSNEIRRLRTEIGLSQTELAIDAGVSRDIIANLELGRTGTTSPVMRKVARALGLRSYDSIIEEAQVG